MTRSFNFLKSLNFPTSDIYLRPVVLCFDEIRLLETKKLLEEFSFQRINISFLANLFHTMDTKIRDFKSADIIAKDADVPENLLKKLDIDLMIPEKLTDELTMFDMKKIIIRRYFEKKFGMSSGSALDTCARGRMIKRRSFESLVKAISILQNRLGISNEDILGQNLVRLCPTNLQRILEEIPSIGGSSIESFLTRFPFLLSRDVDDIKEAIRNIKNFGFTDKQIATYPEILRKDCREMYELLVHFQKIEETKALNNNPSVLKLIAQQQRVTARVEFLSKLALKTGSLSRLSRPQKYFDKYVRDGLDPSKGKDLAIFVSEYFKKDFKKVKLFLRRHPYWKEIPLVDVKATINYLRYKQFSNEDISDNLYLLLYPPSQIELKLQPLLENNFELDGDNDQEKNLGEPSQCRVTKSKLLNICLYHIEIDYHFTGDGIWSTSRNPNQTKLDERGSEDAWSQQKAVSSLST